MNNKKTQLLTEENQVPKKLFLPSLTMSYFVTTAPLLLVGLLLIDIGETFDRPVGVIGLIETAASLTGAFVAVLMGAWSVRFRHKSLLQIGLLCFIISAVVSAIALNIPMLLLAYTISGIGGAMVSPMVFSLVGEHIPLEQRPRAIGWLYSGGALTYFIGSPVIGIIVGVGNWRWAFLGFILPVSLLGLVITIKGVPAASRSIHSPKSKGTYWVGFKGVFANRSATVCLIGSGLGGAGWVVILLYTISFFRQRFLVSVGVASVIFPVLAFCAILGNQVGGQMVHRFGRKPLTIFTAVVTGIFIISFMTIHLLWLALTLVCLGCLFGGMWFTVSLSLTLEQVPKFRGTMMSLSTVAAFLGYALGAGVGGLTLLRWDYEGVGLALGALYLASAILFYLLVIDPTTRTESNHETHMESAQSIENGEV